MVSVAVRRSIPRPAGERAREPQSQGSELSAVLLRYGRHGLRAQLAFRVLLSGLAAGVALAVPAGGEHRVCVGFAAAALLWAGVTASAGRRSGPRLLRWGWVGLLVDLLAASIVILLARMAEPGWWAPGSLSTVLFLLPALAAVQLRPAVCAVVGTLTTLAHLALRLTGPRTGDSLIVLLAPTAVLAGLTLTCVLLSVLQRSRVSALFQLAAERARRGEEELDIDQRERRLLAEHLRVRVLQPVLAVGRHLADAKHEHPGVCAHASETLRTAGDVLGSTLTGLDPVLLQRAGLPTALRQLVAALQPGPDRMVRLRIDGWPDDLRTSLDPVLYGAARGLLVGVLEHGHAATVDVELAIEDGVAVLQVHDAGVGAAAHLLTTDAADGPLGLAARRIRLEAAGGELHLRTGADGGTVARATLPLPRSAT
jgi:two-component system NarL family sensor kinase